jgi:uncharacterized damage-inducible protein DinB
MVPSNTNPDPSPPESPEPWLRGTLPEVPAVVRGVLHALELAKGDIARWCGTLTIEQLEARPMGLPAAAFHIRHIARSLDRLLTYAEGRELSAEQMAGLRAEMQPYGTRAELLGELADALAKSAERVKALRDADLEQPRGVGKLQLPSTVGGLLVHVAEHTQRHVGQAVTTAKVVAAE